MVGHGKLPGTTPQGHGEEIDCTSAAGGISPGCISADNLHYVS